MPGSCCPPTFRDGGKVFETYWTTLRDVEAMDNSYALMDLTVYGRPIAQWVRLGAGCSDDLGTA